MDILSKNDDEIYELAKPIWDNLVRSSNLKDYGGFTKDFSTQMLFGANEVELGKQWANNKIITNLKETFDPFYKQQWENKVKLIKKHFGNFTELDNFVDNLEKSYNKFGLSVKNSSMMQMVDFVWIMAKLKENKNLMDFCYSSIYSFCNN